MSEESLPVDAQKARSAIDELMKTPEGQQLAEKIREKLKGLNEQFKGLSKDDRQKFADEFKGKFTETFEDLKDSLRSSIEGNKDDQSDQELPNQNQFNYSPQQSYTLPLIASIIVLIIFG